MSQTKGYWLDLDLNMLNATAENAQCKSWPKQLYTN